MTAPSPTTLSPLRLDGVGKTYGRHRALIDVSTQFQPGRVAAILGPNGAGKTTLLQILSTLVGPTKGGVIWGTQALSRGSTLRARIGYVAHDPGLYGDLSARQNLELFGRLYGLDDPAARAQELLSRVGLGEARRDAPVRAFSRGMQQRLSLARALLPTPDLLLFDEPASALDPAGAAWLKGAIEIEREAGRLVVLVTHDLAAAAMVADQIVILRRGRVAHDECRDARFTPAELTTIYAEKTRG